MKQKTAEYRLLTLSLFLGFFYLSLRYVVLDTFIWILIPPILALFYMFVITDYRWFSNKMDKIMLCYLINGVIFTVIGIFLAPNKLNITRVFIHLYLPSLLYFISRKYTSVSINNIFKVSNILFAISILFAIDVLIEFYLIDIRGSYEMIPWVKTAVIEYMETIDDPNILKQHYMFFNPINLSSILTNGKGAGIVVSLCFCFIFPFALSKRNQYNRDPALFIHNKSFIIIILIILFICSVILPNFSATLSMLIVSLSISIYKRNIFFPALIFFSIAMAIISFGLIDWVRNIVITKMFTDYAIYGGSILNFIIDLNPIINYYSSNPLEIFFGKIIFYNLYNTAQGGELDLLLYPMNYGLTWFIIVISGIYLAFTYCKRLIKYIPKSNIEQTLGFSFLSFILVMILSNLHYPHYDDHGIIELLFIIIGVLTSFYEMKFYSQKSTFITNS